MTHPGDYSGYKLGFLLSPRLSGLTSMARRLMRRWNPDDSPVKGSPGLRRRYHGGAYISTVRVGKGLILLKTTGRDIKACQCEAPGGAPDL